MNILCRPYLYKVVTPSVKSRLLTKWNEGDPIEQFEAVERIKYPLSKSDAEITNELHEITKQRAAKLYDEKAKLLNPEVENIPEEPQE